MGKLLTFIIGAISGVVVTAVLIVVMAPSVMILENDSKLSFKETVDKIKASAAAKGWKSPVTHELHKAVAKAGFDVKPASVIELCQPKHAGKILSRDENRIVTSLMPCRVSIYETGEGKVVVSRMNSSLVSKIFGGEIAEVMADASKETEEILAETIK